ncbi:MAG: DUF2309 domain-containing protein [Nitrospira sp. CG24C]|nr:MAG: DUF2309 domain-containing protein [Nitrospira sp. CG24C]
MNGDVPYHEPMRLLTVVAAPRERIEKLITRHETLEHYYRNDWVHLVALEPEEGVLYRYRPTDEWVTAMKLTADSGAIMEQLTEEGVQLWER